jgi:Tfp pilus assembly pilus retraction ATPase PilT
MKNPNSNNMDRFRSENFLTRREVAKKFRVTSRTIIRWEEIGILKPRRFGRMVLHAESDVAGAAGFNQ